MFFATQIVQLLGVNFDDGNATRNTKMFGTAAKGNVAPMMLPPSNLEPRPQTTAPTGASKDEHQRAAGSTVNLALFSKAQGWIGLYEGLTGPSFVSNKDSQRRQWQQVALQFNIKTARNTQHPFYHICEGWGTCCPQ